MKRSFLSIAMAAAMTAWGAGADGLRVALATATDRVPMNLLESAGANLTDIFKVPVVAVAAEWPGDGGPAAAAAALLADKSVLAAVVVREGDGRVPMAVYPELRLAVVDALAFSPEGTDAAAMEVRVRKQVERAFCAVLGGGVAPVFAAEDLDSLNGGVAPTAIMAVPRYLRSLGFARKLGGGVRRMPTPSHPAPTNAPAFPAPAENAAKAKASSKAAE